MCVFAFCPHSMCYTGKQRLNLIGKFYTFIYILRNRGSTHRREFIRHKKIPDCLWNVNIISSEGINWYETKMVAVSFQNLIQTFLQWWSLSWWCWIKRLPCSACLSYGFNQLTLTKGLRVVLLWEISFRARENFVWRKMKIKRDDIKLGRKQNAFDVPMNSIWFEVNSPTHFISISTTRYQQGAKFIQLNLYNSSVSRLIFCCD